MDLEEGNVGASSNIDILLTHKIEQKFGRLEKLSIDIGIGDVMISNAAIVDGEPNCGGLWMYLFCGGVQWGR